jgi:hypothetical protein
VGGWPFAAAKIAVGAVPRVVRQTFSGEGAAPIRAPLTLTAPGGIHLVISMFRHFRLKMLLIAKGDPMNKTTATALALMLGIAITARGQDPKPYKDGEVTQLSYIKTKPGKFDDYMKFLDTTFKTLMEADKKAGLITSYSVYSANPRTPGDPDLILAVTVPNMAALDKTDEGDAVAAKVMGTDDTQNKAAIDRESLREVLGGELIRELVLK